MIEGIPDELGPMAEKRLLAIKGKPCPRCQSAMHPFFNPKHMFSPHDPLPRTLGRCVECKLEWDPLTDIIVSPGNAALVQDPFRIRPEDD